jgi:hypothetical protein
MRLPEEGELCFTQFSPKSQFWVRCAFRHETADGCLGDIEREVFVDEHEPAIVLYSGFVLCKVLMSLGVVWVRHQHLTREQPNNE